MTPKEREIRFSIVTGVVINILLVILTALGIIPPLLCMVLVLLMTGTVVLTVRKEKEDELE